ncbi:MAG: hypothetical protein ACR2GY_10705 [Phycisphaerales bacterium]
MFKSLNDHEVKYLVIGGVAAGVHVIGRVTYDLDILIEATLANATRLLEAFEAAGLGTAGLTTPESLLAHEITIFRDVVQIDVQVKAPGIEFAEAWQRREVRDFGGIEFVVVAREDLVASKRAADGQWICVTSKHSMRKIEAHSCMNRHRSHRPQRQSHVLMWVVQRFCDITVQQIRISCWT